MLVLYFGLIDNILYSWMFWDKRHAKEKQDQNQSCQKQAAEKYKDRKKPSSSILQFISELGCIFILFYFI